MLVKHESTRLAILAYELGMSESYTMHFIHKLKTDGLVASTRLPELGKSRLYYVKALGEEEAVRVYQTFSNKGLVNGSVYANSLDFHLLTLGNPEMDRLHSVYA